MAAACVPIANPSLEQQKEAYRLIDQGTMELREGKFDRAQASYEVAFELAQMPAALDGLGCVAFARGDIENAAKWFKEANRRDPEYKTALRNLAAVYEEQGYLRQAEFLLRGVIASNPQDHRARNNLAVLLDSSGREKLAEVKIELMKSAATVASDLVGKNVDLISERN